MARITRRTFTGGLTAAAGLGAGTRAAWSQAAFPNGQTLKFIVGFPAGGAQDIIGRVIADRMGALWGVPTVVENISGAGANIAMDRVAKGPADGTQIMIVPPGIAINQFMFARMPFDPEKDLVPLGQVASLPNLLCVKNALPIKSVAELIAYTKANPGKLNFASTSVGTSTHLSGELFKKMAGVDITTVHYRGSAPAINDMLAGSIDMIFDNISSIISQARAGTVRPLAVTTLKRSTIAPEFPAISETIPGYDTTSWVGVGVRAGTPQAICDKIEAGSKTICADPLLKERLATLVAESVGSSAAEFKAYAASERVKWGGLITELKIKAE